ncbi:MAG: TetR/AcrR family transcriptional regulator [bacterium]
MSEKNNQHSLFSDLEDKKRRICEASIEIFKEKSFNKTTVSEIASEAGVGKGTFYLYFNSKIMLLDFLLERGTEELIDKVKCEIEKGESPEQKLHFGIEAQLEFFYNHLDFFDFYIREIWSHREGLREQIHKLREKYIVIYIDILKEGIESGEFCEVDSKTISSGLFGMMSSASFHWLLFSDEFPLSTVEDSIKKVFFEGILN